MLLVVVLLVVVVVLLVVVGGSLELLKVTGSIKGKRGSEGISLII